MNTKICNKCKLEFPNTLDYFLKHEIKREVLILKPICRECYRIKMNLKQATKAAQRWGISLEEYLQNPNKCKTDNLKKILTKYYFDRSELTLNEIRLRQRIFSQGYTLENYFDKQWEKRRFIIRKGKYLNIPLSENVPHDLINKDARDRFTKAYAAGCLKISVKDLTNELYEAFKEVRNLKKQLK